MAAAAAREDTRSLCARSRPLPGCNTPASHISTTPRTAIVPLFTRAPVTRSCQAGSSRRGGRAAATTTAAKTTNIAVAIRTSMRPTASRSLSSVGVLGEGDKRERWSFSSEIMGGRRDCQRAGTSTLPGSVTSHRPPTSRSMAGYISRGQSTISGNGSKIEGSIAAPRN